MQSEPTGEESLREGPGPIRSGGAAGWSRCGTLLTLIGLGLWFGLAAGMAEVGILLYLNFRNPGYYLGEHQLSRHFSWLLPLGQAVLLGGLAGGLAVVGWRLSPVRVTRLVVFALIAAATYSILLMVDGLYDLAAVVLGVGVASQVTPRVVRHPRLVRWGVGLSLPLLVVAVAILGARAYEREVRTEARAVAALKPAAPGSPNVLFVVLDTVSASHLSLYGYGKPTSPRIDALARRGVTFEMARAPASWTLPSHASMFTGYWPNELHVGLADVPLDTRYPTLAEFFADRGYYTTGFVGNTYFCNTWYGLARGFQHYEDFFEQNRDIAIGTALRSSALGRRLTSLVSGTPYNVREGKVNAPKDGNKINRDFQHWLKHHGDRPFFAFLNYLDAHDPYVAPPGFKRHLGEVPQTDEEREHLRAWGRFAGAHIADTRVVPDPRDLRLAEDGYDDCIAALDRMVGRVVDTLEERGVLQNTIVVITSDHGEQFGEHNQYVHGASLYRPELHVPLLILAPNRVPEGQRIAAPVSTREIAATLADLVAGTSGPPPFPGRSLVGFWDSSRPRPTPADDAVVSILQTRVNQEAAPVPNVPPGVASTLTSLVVDDQVYIRDDFGYEELFHLWADPHETTNLADRPELAAVLQRCRAAWKSVWTRPTSRPFYDVSAQEPRGIRR